MNNNITANILGSITKNQIQNNTGVTTSDNAIIKKAVMDMLKDILPGDVVSGKLVSKEDSSISLLMKDNILLNTVLDQNINLSVGKQVSFEVLNNQNGQLTLRPMFTNLNNSSTILNALNEASIPISDSTTKMVDELMKNSMPIDKNTLTNVNRELNLYPDADVMDIVLLHKMNLPVNDNNINEMHLYNNNNQWMMQNVESSTNELMTVIEDMVNNASKGELESFVNGLKDALAGKVPNTDDVVITSKTLETDSTNVNNNLADGDSALLAERTDTPNIENSNVTSYNDKPHFMGVENSVSNLKMSNQTSENINNNNVVSENSIQDKNNLVQDNKITDISDKNAVVSDSNMDGAITDNRGQLPDINKYNVFDEIIKNSKELFIKPELREHVKNAILESLKDNLLMNPKDVAKDDYIKNYYEQTSRLADTLSKLLENHGKSETEFAKSTENIKNNMEFMNKINEFYNYVQLPLKMNDAHANGDLYVYAKKKNKNGGESSDKLTALLHLSMEYLGNMDILLTLKNGNNLSTKFTLEKEEMIDFIAEHIDELNNRLAAKGYTLGVQEITKSEDSSRSVIEKIQGEDSGRILLSNQSFDARA